MNKSGDFAIRIFWFSYYPLGATTLGAGIVAGTGAGFGTGAIRVVISVALIKTNVKNFSRSSKTGTLYFLPNAFKVSKLGFEFFFL